MGGRTPSKNECQVKIDLLRGKDTYELIEYNGLSKKATIKHNKNNCNYDFNVNCLNNFLGGSGGCPICDTRVKNQTTETVSIRLDRLTRGEFNVIGEYQGMRKPISIIHTSCNTKFNRTLDGVFHRIDSLSCPKCSNNAGGVIIPFVNDVSVTNPQLASLFYNEEDTHKFREYSNKEALFQCPYCKEIIKNRIDYVNTRGLSCPKCGDGISYPEKFIYNFLKQLDIDFDTQFMPDWAKPYRYDFVFKLNKIKYIIEADGHFHYKNCGFSSSKDVKNVDSIKDTLAIEHGYKIIRIACNYKQSKSRYNYIKESIVNSDLNNIFDLSVIDFDSCDKYATGSIIYKIATDYNKGIVDNKYLCSKYQVKKQALMLYVKRACNIGLIDDTFENVSKKFSKEVAKRKAIEIGHVVKCNETNEIFYSFVEPERKYGSSLKQYFNNNWQYSGRLPDGTKLTWQKIK